MTANAVAIASPTIIEAIPDTRKTLDLVIYWRSIAKRKWAILAMGAAFALVAAAMVQLMTPIYRSTATLLIEQNKAKVAPTEEVYANIGDSREHFQTQAEILKARALAIKLVDKLDLTRHPDFDPRQHRPPLLDRIRQQIGWPASEKPWTEEALRKAVVDSLMRRLTIEPVRLSQLIRVSFESPDPYVAADIANAVSQIYVDSDNEARLEMNVRAGDWLGSRLAGLRKNLEDSERALQEYRERARIIDTKGLAQSGATRQIEDLMTRLVAARQRRYVTEHAYQQVNSAKGQVDTLPVVIRNPLVLRLKELENEAERRVSELSNRYGPEHPRMEQAEAELQQAKANTRRQIDIVVSSLVNDYELARANEQALERSVAEAKGDVQVINRKEFQLASLERAVATNRQIYELFLNRFRETSAARGPQANAVARLTDEARPSQLPIKPKKEQIISIAFMLGIVFGALISLLLERLNNTLNSTDDVEEKLGQPLLTALPLLRGRAAKDLGRHYLQDPGSLFSEAIRTARTGVLLSSTGTGNVSVLVTSSIPDEGKTAVAINLALAQAQTKRVLLVDADLRQPAFGQQLGLTTGKPGLTDLLSGAATFAECLQRIDGTSLYVLSTGQVPLNPLELLMSQRFKQLVKALASTCDVLILDSPPVHLVSDALVLSKLVSGVVFVVKADSTPYPLARRCIEALDDVDANLFGVTLNQLDFKKADRYYGAYTGAYYKYDGYYTRVGKSLSAPAPVAAARS
jgi:polysaccharide biosynthesis transport protein